MNLRTKVALALGAIFVLVMAIVGGGAAVTAQYSSQQTIDRSLTSNAKRILERDTAALVEIEDTCGRGQSGNQFRGDNDLISQIVLANGRGICATSRTELPISDADIITAQQLDASSIAPRTITHQGRSFRTLTVPLGEISIRGRTTAAAVQIARPFEELDEVRDAVLLRVAMFGLLGSLAAAGIGWAVIRRIAQPIETLTVAAERVAATQDLSQRIPVDRTDEVGRMATSFNTMLDALDASRRQQHQLVQDANHELRTPLTSLRTNIELLQRAKTLPDGERDNLLADVSSELGELTSLVEELVTSATDVTSNTEQPHQFDLGDLANDVAERARRRTGRIINVHAEAAIDVTARETMIDRAVTNLVNNAIKFSPDSFPIDVHVDGARIEVRDSGPGIPADDIDKIFERFYRSDEARSQPGSGLGLSIVRQVAINHGGRVWAENRPAGGATIGFEINPAGPGPKVHKDQT